MSMSRREELIRVLPYARRYARALTGSQIHGDGLVAESLRAMLTDAEADEESRISLYREVTRRSAASVANGAGLTTAQRQLLLLTTLEEFRPADAAGIVGLGHAEADALLGDARQRLRAAASTKVLIIEDEPIIAMDLEELVASCGHRVVGVAATEAEAVEIATRTPPGLILADINLGVGGDGAHAVARILKTLRAPVIFVTAYPERLLTGESSEPAFVITKPFEPLTLAIATYQAVTGGVALD